MAFRALRGLTILPDTLYIFAVITWRLGLPHCFKFYQLFLHFSF